jgi:DNA-binding protein HU-beta
MAKKAATPTTVTLKHLAAALSEEHELSKKGAEAILNDLVARMGRNPATGEAIHIKASKKVAFRAAKELKEAV